MVTIRSVNEIILSLIDFFRLAQPDLDTKPGTVARDLFVDGPASQLSLLYDQISNVASQQSMRLVVGSDLDKLAKNFGVIRKQSTPASGVALLTFSSINAPIAINRGDTVIANNGFSYSISSGLSVIPSASNFYRSVASKFSNQLSIAGITDQFAVEVTVVATTPGTAGNIGTFSVNRTNISGVSNTTNINSFTGGTDQENDTTFRNRVLASFSGSSVGTALGYLNVALGTTGVSDATVIEPGNPLMTRDGTVVKVNSDGSRTIISEGSGGKVDVVILGSSLIESKDSFIFQDKSNNNDPTSSKNNVVLGQIAADVNKTINRKRIDNIKNGQVPSQPVNTLLQVSGSTSGSNFIPKSVDSFGRVTGNYELVKDIGVYGGSPFGFDTFRWVSDRISDFSEDRIKGQNNGQDVVTFPGVLEISGVQQNIPITNENSIVTFDRSIIKLLHTPATNVTRVFNVNTGERYIISNQNIDQTGTFNTTGRIKISGNTLPSPSDVLQVDYSWIVDYDQYSDYDGLFNTKNPRDVTDSIDWGLANIIRDERVIFSADAGDNFFQGTTSHPIDTIVSVKKFIEVDSTVSLVTSGHFINRLSVVITNLADPTLTVDSISLKNSNSELYSTAQNNGIFTNASIIVGIELLNETTIILPTDTIAEDGDKITVIVNSVETFHSDASDGSSSGTQITIPATLIDTTANSIILRVTYISSVSDLFSSATTSLPSSRFSNGFALSNNNGFNNFSQTNISIRENLIVQKNLSNQYFVELNLSSTDFSVIASQVLSAVRLLDGKEIWNSTNPGTIVIGSSGNYQLIFSGFNTPTTNDRVLVVYYASDTKRFQPFSYSNIPIKVRTDTLSLDISGSLSVLLNNITTQGSSVKFSVIEPNTDIELFSVTDGYITSNGDGTAFISSLATNFSSLADLTNKKIKVTGSTLPITDNNNSGLYDIVSYNSVNNKILITEVLDNISADQICVIRALDSKEIWNYSGTIDITNNKILIPSTAIANTGDLVYIILFNFNTLRKGPTRLTGAISDQVINNGIITVNGTTINKAQDVVFTATNTGLKLNLSEALRKALGLNSTASIPTNIRIARIIKVEHVTTASITDDTVLEVITTYDTKNSIIRNNLLYLEDMLADGSLQNTDFILPTTLNNSGNSQPKIGDKVRVTFYYITENDQENLAYTRNGTLYTNKKFALLNRVFVASGFKSSTSTKFTASSFTQPGLGARYKAFYDYTAPKLNERIVVTYNFNKLISDVTFNVEDTRPINSDVIVREAKLILLDLTMNVVIDSAFTSSSTTVLQNLRNQLISAMTTNLLGQVIDTPTLINVAQAVSGIARARIIYFNKTGGIGQVIKVQAQEDEFFASNNIIINTETR